MMRKLLLVLLLFAVGAAGLGWWQWRALTDPYRGFPETEVFVEFPAGTSVSTMAAKLAAAGVVPNALTFRIAARLSGEERRLQAGEYRFADPATPYEVVDRLIQGDVFVRPLTFPEGLTAVEMSDIFAASGLGTASDFVAAARQAALVADLDPRADTLEGYLFPDTYTLARRTEAGDVIEAMVDRFKSALDPDLRAEVDRSGLSLREVVTLASLIEKETAVAAERPLVSAVYRNRLSKGMLLQCDPTVIYAMMRARRWRGNITRADLQMDSPYNTYRYPGLPPGPIASPGRASIEAALRPAEVSYLYFVSRNDGSHVFSNTLAEHNRAVNQWQRR